MVFDHKVLDIGILVLLVDRLHKLPACMHKPDGGNMYMRPVPSLSGKDMSPALPHALGILCEVWYGTSLPKAVNHVDAQPQQRRTCKSDPRSA